MPGNHSIVARPTPKAASPRSTQKARRGDWFATQKASTFFPEVPVIFEADGSVEHYHIPLLLSPYGFSTYRGN